MKKAPNTTHCETLDCIVSIIGFDAAYAMSRQQKRERLYIPKTRMTDDFWLVEAIGRDLADKLQKHFAAEKLPWLKLKLTRCKLDADIATAWKNGATQAEASKTFGVCHTTAKRACHRHTVTSNRWRTNLPHTPPV